MKILIITRLFYPDTASVAQHTGDLAFALANEGHEVVVFTSPYAYEDPSITYPHFEEKNKVTIIRLNHWAAGKDSKFRRVMDFLSYNVHTFFKLLFYPKKKVDMIFGLTNPPMLSFIGAFVAKLKGIKFGYWTMDLQPELAIEAGYIKKGSISANILTFMGNYVFRNSQLIITLDRFMKDYIQKRIAKQTDSIKVLSVWSVVPNKYEGTRLENPFRIEHNFGNKTVIMYSGNHAVVHSLDTILNVAKILENDDRFLFVFVGGGVRKADVTEFKQKYGLNNIIQLPYQPREKIHLSLGSADLHLVIMGDGHVGYTHPNKIYGAMFLEKPIIYVGPSESHVTDIFQACNGNISVKHNESIELANKIIAFHLLPESEKEAIGKQNGAYIHQNFNPQYLIQQHVNLFNNTTP